jgi:hypothetical protein
MKRIVQYLSIACLCIPTIAVAQPGPAKIDLGIKAGVNLSKLNGKTWDGGYKAGLLGGAYVGVNVKKIGGQIELLYSNATFTASGEELHKASISSGKTFLKNIGDTSRNGNISVSYLSVPLLLNLRLFGNAVIQLGPQYTSVLSVQDKDNFLADPKNFLATSDVSGVVGLWLKLPKKVNAGIRYTFGFSDQNFSSLGESWKNRNIQIHLGYSFL